MIKSQVVIADFSFWQDDDFTPYKIDMKTAYQAGLDGVILRAGQNTWIDEDYLDYCKNADEAGLPRGAYWFFDSRVSPIPQADLFADIVEMSGDFPALGIWADYEEKYGGVYGGEKHFKQFIDKLQLRFPGKLIGVYTGPSYWREHTTVLGRGYFKKFPLWIANYKVFEPDIPPPWGKNDWRLWQFTAEGDGAKFGAESKEIDLNYFNGDLDDYREFFKIPYYEPYTPANTGEKMYDCKVKSTATPYVNIRATPNGLDLGDINMYPDEVFQADKIDLDGTRRPWLHSIKPGKEGWILASLCDYEEVQDPNPEPEPTGHVLEVFVDGVLKYREEF